MKVVDGDSHFIEPLDVYPRYIDPAFRERAMRVERDPDSGKQRMLVDGRPMRLGSRDIDEMLSIIVGYGQKEEGSALDEFDRSMKRPIREYFARNIWINADPSEKLLPYIVQFVGDEKFFVGSDYPHAEGFTQPIQTMRGLLSDLPAASLDKILGANAAAFYRIEA